MKEDDLGRGGSENSFKEPEPVQQSTPPPVPANPPQEVAVLRQHSDFHDPRWVRSNPGQVINYLQELENGLRWAREDFRRADHRSRQLESDNRELNRRLGELHGRWARDFQELERLRRRAQDLLAAEEKVRSLTSELQRLKAENSDLDTAKRDLLRQVSSRDRDHTAVSALGARSRFELSQEFQGFRDRINRWMRSVALRDRSLSRSAAQPRMAWLASRLSETVFLESGKPLSAEAEGKTPDWLLEGALHREGFEPLSEAARGEVHDLVRDGMDLVSRLSSTDPPMSFWFPEAGARCVRGQGLMEAERFSEEEGRIAFTVFPGLWVGSRPLVPAIVWIEKGEVSEEEGTVESHRRQTPPPIPTAPPAPDAREPGAEEDSF